MKHWNVSAFFPEVKPAHQAFQSCTAYGGRASIAVSRALDEMFSLPGIKGRHITEVRLTVKEIGKVSSSKGDQS